MDAGNSKNKRCSVCERDYKSRNGHYRHMKTVHKDVKREPASASGRRIDINYTNMGRSKVLLSILQKIIFKQDHLSKAFQGNSQRRCTRTNSAFIINNLHPMNLFVKYKNTDNGVPLLLRPKNEIIIQL